MGEERRRLTAILFADIVGFSQQMIADEEGCIRARNDVAQLLQLCATEHGGAVKDEAGDGFMLVFESAVDAVKAAIAIQREMGKCHSTDLDTSSPQLRIGIHCGDIVVEGDSLLGDAVNVAARVETVAKPGGICITAEVENQVRPVLDLELARVTRKPAKPYPRQITVYDLLDGPSPAKALPSNLVRRRLAIGAAALAVITLAVVLIPWPQSRGASNTQDPSLGTGIVPPSDEGSVMARPTPESGGRDIDAAAIAVLIEPYRQLARDDGLKDTALQNLFKGLGSEMPKLEDLDHAIREHLERHLDLKRRIEALPDSDSRKRLAMDALAQGDLDEAEGILLAPHAPVNLHFIKE